MEDKTVHVPALSCSHCTATIEREVGEIPGVESVSANHLTRSVTFRWSEPATWEAIEELMGELGYPPAG
jgi:copper chaperone